MVNTTRRTSTGFSSSNTEAGNSKKASWRRCFGSLVVKNEQECFRWVLEGHAGYRERKLHVGKVDAMWGGLGLERWVRPDAKQDVWRHTCVKTYMELEQKKKRPIREFQSTSFIFSFINTSRFFFKCSTDLYAYIQPCQYLVEKHSHLFTHMSWSCGSGIQKGHSGDSLFLYNDWAGDAEARGGTKRWFFHFWARHLAGMAEGWAPSNCWSVCPFEALWHGGFQVIRLLTQQLSFLTRGGPGSKEDVVKLFLTQP